MKYCPKCGAANEDNVAFCAACGEKMDAEPTKVDTVVEAPVSNVNTGEASAGWFWLGLLFGGVAAIIVGAILKNKRWPSLGKKLMTGGIVGTIISVVLYFILILVYVLIFVGAAAIGGAAGAI